MGVYPTYATLSDPKFHPSLNLQDKGGESGENAVKFRH